MAKHEFILLFILPFMLKLSMSLLCSCNEEERKVHIVYMGSIQGYSTNFLTKCYRRSFKGFAAKLTDQEANKMSGMKRVVSIFPSKTFQLQTTRSWDFMGFKESIKRNPTVESDIIIGVIDTGIWPELECFSDEGFGPAPKKWKGSCKGGQTFTCNNKISEAQTYIGNDSARDVDGHGSHTASKAAGNKVKDVGFYGLAQGMVRGGWGFPLQEPLDVSEDVIAIGAFHAMKKGILTVHSAGNNGLGGAFTVVSIAPWLLSVAASRTGRKFINKVILGNGNILTGSLINTFSLNGTKFPLVYGKEVSNNDCEEYDSRNCIEGCLDENAVKGKIMLCDSFQGIFVSKDSVALGTISIDDGSGTDVSYLNSTEKPELRAEFESTRFLKPDLTAPGVDILATYSPEGLVTGDSKDDRHVKYNILFGTSMSCPHVAAAAAYIKTFHPDWSPSAIKSALMTTAWPMNQTYHPDVEFASGSGHINPAKAAHPGLVYEVYKEDYIKLMCSMGYDADKLKAASGITNVGNANSNYMADFSAHSRLNVSVAPTVLSFNSMRENKSFQMTVTGGALKIFTVVSTSMSWSDGSHIVRSPIVIRTYHGLGI
ncbi:hypothetical protein SLA2020_120000 [Shorea laevis]